MKSVRQVADAHGVQDRTVRNWLAAARRDGKELGKMLKSKRMFTEEEVVELAAYGRQSDDVSEPEAIEPEFVVEEGNHRELRTLSVPGFSSLENFRTDRIRLGLANPRQFVAQVDGFLDQLEQCMDQAEAEQEQELALTQQTKRRAAKRISRFHRRADEYRIRTDILASIQNTELDEIDDMAEEVDALGKPLPSESQGSGLS